MRLSRPTVRFGTGTAQRTFRLVERLLNAARYITKLPKAEHDAPEWQAAMQALLLVAEHGDPMMAHIAMMQALQRHEPKAAPAPRRKRAKAYRII